jgi:hypothetical protein
MVNGLLTKSGDVLLQLGDLSVFAGRVACSRMHLCDKVFQLRFLVLHVDIVSLHVLVFVLLQNYVH